MKVTTDYIVGNTAIQIVSKGNRIRVVNTEKEKHRKQIIKKSVFVTLLGSMLFFCCMSVVHLNSRKIFLDKQIYVLQGEIEELERTIPVNGAESENAVNYRIIYKKATELGMRFPKKEQIRRYSVEKSTAVRLSEEAWKNKEKK